MQPGAHGSPETAGQSFTHRDTSSLHELHNPEAARIEDKETAAFPALRKEAYNQIWQDITHRLATNPIPTEEERRIGTYIEALEPQVRSAVLTMRRKGYNTVGSGFDDSDWRIMGINNPLRTNDYLDDSKGQAIDFEPFIISEETREQLHALGAELPEYPVPELKGYVVCIGFTPETPDLDAIAATWQAIADVLPDTGTPAGPREGTLEEMPFIIYRPPDVNWPAKATDPTVQPYLDKYLRW